MKESSNRYVLTYLRGQVWSTGSPNHKILIMTPPNDKNDIVCFEVTDRFIDTPHVEYKDNQGQDCIIDITKPLFKDTSVLTGYEYTLSPRALSHVDEEIAKLYQMSNVSPTKTAVHLNEGKSLCG